MNKIWATGEGLKGIARQQQRQRHERIYAQEFVVILKDLRIECEGGKQAVELEKQVREGS